MRSAQAGALDARTGRLTSNFKVQILLHPESGKAFGYSLRGQEISIMVRKMLDFYDFGFVTGSDIGIRKQLFAPDTVLVEVDQGAKRDQEDRNDPDWQENQ